jgi:hypothetical protein
MKVCDFIKENNRELPEKVKCKLVKIANRKGHPNFHFEIDGKIYFYEFRGIKSDYKIALYCSKSNGKSKCGNTSLISPSDCLKQIIQNTPNCTEYPKNIDKTDPRVFDIQNYDINSFNIGRGHSCPGTEIDKYMKIDIKNVNCKLMKIDNNGGQPKFYFEIDEKFYIYGFRGIRADYKIVLCCNQRRCNNSAYISPTELLRQLIQDTPNNGLPFLGKYSNFFDISDTRVYDINNFDSNSFEIRGSHKCQGTELDEFIKIDVKNVKCKLVKIENKRRHPKFHFEIDGQIYFYCLRGIKADYKIALCCTQKSCLNTASISPSEFLKQVIHDKPKNSGYSKVLNLSDPRVYDINNYDSNSFEIRGRHKCPGTEHDVYVEKMQKKDEKIKKMQTSKNRQSQRTP